MKSMWIAVAGRKGGVGKTSLALSLAARKARAGKHVVFVDLDPQGSASLVLGVDTDGRLLSEMLSGKGTSEFVKSWNDMILLPGGPEIEGVPTPIPLRKALAWAKADIFVLDCPPGHTGLERLALDAADVVLACSDAHSMGMAGVTRVVAAAVGRTPKPCCAGVLGRMDFRRVLDREAPHLLKTKLRVPILTMRQDAELAACLNDGRPPPLVGHAADDAERISTWIARKT